MDSSTKLSVNWLLTTFNQLFIIIVPLVTTPYITRVLSGETLGIYVYCLSIYGVFVTLGRLGLALHGKRIMAIYHNDRKTASRLFSEVFFLSFALSIVSLLAYFLFSLSVGKYTQMFLVCSIGHLSTLFDITWLFEGFEDFYNVVKKNLIVKIASIIAMFIFVKSPADIYIYALIIVGSNVIGPLTLWPYMSRYVSLVRPRLHDVLSHLRPAFLLFLPFAIVQFSSVVNTVMIGNLSSDVAQVSFYDQSMKIITFSMSFLLSLGAVLMPRLSHYFHEGHVAQVKQYTMMSADFTLLLGVFVMLSCFLVTPTFVPWFFGPEFACVDQLIMAGTPLILLMGLNDILGAQLLTATMREKQLFHANLSSFLISIALNFVLVPQYGAMGAIVVGVLSQFLKSVHILYYTRGYITPWFIIRRFLKYSVYGIVPFVAAYMVFHHYLKDAVFVNTVIVLLLFSVMYLLVLLLFRNTWIDFVWSKIQQGRAARREGRSE